ncbi:hypothetical protein ACIB24_12535 [Spongisporangium articulatum]|uniref:Uncharacterized protein n=1 Tax=Spongisporangium articulatum TaxID=3362603 RepID=A0ABW8AND7_9ACTN
MNCSSGFHPPRERQYVVDSGALASSLDEAGELMSNALALIRRGLGDEDGEVLVPEATARIQAMLDVLALCPDCSTRAMTLVAGMLVSALTDRIALRARIEARLLDLAQNGLQED